MIVYVCRHAEAVAQDRADGVDEYRWLTPRGQTDALAIGQSLHARGERPALLASSPHVRAVQTAERLAWALGHDPERAVFGELSLGSPLGPLLSRLEAVSREYESVMLVGHEPTMTVLGSTLLGRRFPRPWPTAGVLRIDFDREVIPGAGREAFFLSPDELGKG